MARSSSVPEAYDGHEQSLIKHELLKGYLQELFLVVGGSARRGGQISLCYVDCFAGPWGDDSEAMESTSIAISLRTLDSVRLKLRSNGVNATIRALYIEKDARAFARLSAYLKVSTPDGIHAEARHGDFIALRGAILQWTGSDAFVFFFIDPKGWKGVDIETMRPLLRRPRSEFLITFMYDFVNRTMSMTDWQPEMAELVGEAIDLDHMAPDDRERSILSTYRANLKSCVTATSSRFPPRSAYVRVLDPKRERPKYHLVYITSHPFGVIKFMTISDGVDLVQKQVRAAVQDAERERRTGTGNLFAAASLVDPNAGRASADDVDRYWLDYIATEIRSVDREAFADILEQTDWFPRDLQASLVRLIERGEVKNLDAPRRRPTNPLHYDVKGGERLQRTGRQA